MTQQSQREIIVRPHKEEELIAPIHEEVGDLEDEPNVEGEVVDQKAVEDGDGRVVHTDVRTGWEKMRDKIEDLAVKVTRHFEDENDETGWKPPMVKSPTQPTQDEWMRHKLAHTPFAAWCKHCNTGRAVRAHHQRADKRARLVPDTDKSNEGPGTHQYGLHVFT